MGEPCQQSDSVSVFSEEDLNPPSGGYQSHVAGRGALHPNEFDPLKHSDWENFWHQVDHHFHPINRNHLRAFHSIGSTNNAVGHDPDLVIAHLDDLEVVRAAAGVHQETRDDVSSKIEPSVDAHVGHLTGLREEVLGISDAAFPQEAVTVDGGGIGGGMNEHDARIWPAKLSIAIKAKKEPTTSSDHPKSPIICHLPQNDGVPATGSTSAPVDPDSAAMRASLNSFPYTHRLVAALIDENILGTVAPTISPHRANQQANEFNMTWIGGNNEPNVRVFQAALEEQVKNELRDVGLLNGSEDDDVVVAMRQEQWKLRDKKDANRVKKNRFYLNAIIAALRKQAKNREEKRQNDKVEIAYLEGMIAKMKKNKKSRAKFQKLLERMFLEYEAKNVIKDRKKKSTGTSSKNRMHVSGDEKMSTSDEIKRELNNKSYHALPPNSVPGPSTASPHPL